MKKKIQEFVLSLGISPTVKGYHAICVGIRLLMDHPEYGNQITKSLYPRIAAECGLTKTSVERNIRTAVERMFDTQGYDDIVGKLKLSPNMNKCKYTNSEFLTACALLLGEEQL